MDTSMLLEHHREKALNAAALLMALSTSRIDPENARQFLKQRQGALMEELLHEFAFSARKYIEQVTAIGVPMRAHAEKMALIAPRVGGGVRQEDPTPFRSLWWALGRIIHSSHLEVDFEATYEDHTDPPRFREHAWGFVVRSDLDQADERHLFYIEFLIDRFVDGELSFQHDIAVQLARFRNPAA